jgi:uncharacterized protein (DUF3820 family)
MILPFGKYAGWDIRGVPEAYLRWLRANAQSPVVQAAVKMELEIRERRQRRRMRGGYRRHGGER